MGPQERHRLGVWSPGLRLVSVPRLCVPLGSPLPLAESRFSSLPLDVWSPDPDCTRIPAILQRPPRAPQAWLQLSLTLP